jgi:hypothetical protein
MKATDGRITAKRLLLVARAAGYVGSARTLRRAVPEQKRRWKWVRRVYRPWLPAPGEHLVVDYETVTIGSLGMAIDKSPTLRWERTSRRPPNHGHLAGSPFALIRLPTPAAGANGGKRPAGIGDKPEVTPAPIWGHAGFECRDNSLCGPAGGAEPCAALHLTTM